ncbi:MAG: HAD-IA family hydrolase [Nitrospiraceae bacterium]|nr:HAD-IA family hydrolase [Nitrospiraceae bacterium]
MPFNSSAIRAIIFDYGNTLIAFGPEQIAACDQALADELGRLFGPPDMARVTAVRDIDRVRPYSGDPPEYRENDLPRITAGLVRSVYGVEPSQDQVDALLRVRFEAFVGAIEVSGGMRTLVARLGQRYRLGLLSNYPDGDAIRASLRRTGLDALLDVVVVSADVGYVKPHPLPFERVTKEMDISPEEGLFVGDNWLADIQGAKRAGMRAAYTTEFIPYGREHFEPGAGDHEPDLRLDALAELEARLTGRAVEGACD